VDTYDTRAIHPAAIKQRSSFINLNISIAIKGVLATTNRTLKAYYATCDILGATGATYRCAVYAITGASTISSIVAISDSYTFAAAIESVVLFTFSTPAVFASGTTYAIVGEITSGTATPPCNVSFPAGGTWGCPGFNSLTSAGTSIRSANLSPTVGTTLGTASSGQVQLNW
jgi:hypothetical protein